MRGLGRGTSGVGQERETLKGRHAGTKSGPGWRSFPPAARRAAESQRRERSVADEAAGAPGLLIHSVSRRRPRVGRGPPSSHLSAIASTRRSRPRAPPPTAWGTRAGGQQSARAIVGAGRGLASVGAGRARPSSTGPSRAAAGSDTCRAAPPRRRRSGGAEAREGPGEWTLF